MMRAVTLDSDTEEDIAVVMMNRAKSGQLCRSVDSENHSKDHSKDHNENHDMIMTRIIVRITKRIILRIIVRIILSI